MNPPELDPSGQVKITWQEEHRYFATGMVKKKPIGWIAQTPEGKFDVLVALPGAILGRYIGTFSTPVLAMKKLRREVFDE